MMAFLVLRLVLIIFVIGIVQCRILKLNSSDNEFISDGTDLVKHLPSVPNTCDHQYGFLPCAENAGGYVFQILVYQGLLAYGGNSIGKGSKVIFDIMGVGKIGGIVFRILTSLPSMILMILSGVFSSKQSAQSMVSAGVGINAGITVFSLTLQWAICVIYGKKRLPKDGASGHTEESKTKCLPAKRAIVVLKDSGVTIDEPTQTTAGIMLLSLIPYAILQLDVIFTTSSGTRVVTLISLIVSSLSLIAYFIYQVINPWIQERCLHYSKHEILRTEFLKHVQQQGRLMNEKGELNTEFLKKLFSGLDKDHNNSVSDVEMEKLVLEIIGTGKLKIDQKFAISEIMKTFDGDGNTRIGEEEFIAGCKRWIEETPRPSEISDSSKHIFHELLTLFKENSKHDPRKKELVVSKILKHAETELLKAQSLVTADGKPNDEQIKALFRKFDSNEDNSISRSELEGLLKTVKFGETQLKYEDILHDLFKDFDTDNNNVIDEPEFVEGLKKYVDKAIRISKAQDKTKAIDEYHEMVWTPKKYTEWDLFQSIFEILFGIVLLTFLGGPLMTSILQLSYAMGLPSFCISFVIVPIATNATTAFKAILPSRHKTEFMASLTFSEIYGGVIMNNVSGMTALLAIVLAKDLTFDFSAEVLTVLVVCAIIGALAYSRRSYPIWTCVLALFLYPFSLALFYFVQFFLNWN